MNNRINIKNILLTGGLGYIGSHTAIELLINNYNVVIIDNLFNTNIEVKDRIKDISERDFKFYNIDVKDRNKLKEIFKENKIDVVIHFAGHKAVGESIKDPIEYYRNNLDTTLSILECMKEFKVSKMIFSSSATVYGPSNPVPYIETMEKGACSNPYGWTKSFNEQILEDYSKSDNSSSIISLRYFNPVGAHKSGKIGELPNGIPNNLMPYITQVASGILNELTIFGNDYNTEDGTCKRDFIHVVDLAKAHVAALDYLDKFNGIEYFNVGTGEAYSILEILKTFERVNNIEIPFKFGPRRDGDLPDVWANIDKIKSKLNWEAKYNLEDMCKDSWNWQKNISKFKNN